MAEIQTKGGFNKITILTMDEFENPKNCSGSETALVLILTNSKQCTLVARMINLNTL